MFVLEYIRRYSRYHIEANTLRYPHLPVYSDRHLVLDPNTISASDYRVFNSNPSTVIAAQLSNDTTIVELVMQIPFETDDTPFVEQIDSISDISGNVL